MTVELVVLITAVIGLITAILAYLGNRDSRRAQTTTTVEPPPSDPEDESYIETTVWERTPIRVPDGSGTRGPIVLSVVAMKGGVGKTTVAANLAAHFSAAPQNKKVLLIDFDYQSNLSVTVMNHVGVTDVAMTSHKLLIGKEDPSVTVLRAPANHLRRQDAGRVSIFTAHYSLATVENELMGEWLRSPETRDVRFNLRRYLASDAFARQFDMVIVDCPPRLTTGAINALAASTHVILPTVLDNLSAPAAVYFSRQLVRMRPTLFPRVKLVGVVPSISTKSTGLSDREARVATSIEGELATIWPHDARPANRSIVMTQAFVPRTGPIGDAAGLGLAYFRNNAAKAIFSRLGGEVEERLAE